MTPARPGAGGREGGRRAVARGAARRRDLPARARCSRASSRGRSGCSPGASCTARCCSRRHQRQDDDRGDDRERPRGPRRAAGPQPRRREHGRRRRQRAGRGRARRRPQARRRHGPVRGGRVLGPADARRSCARARCCWRTCSATSSTATASWRRSATAGWRRCAGCRRDARLVLNADDPLVADLGRDRDAVLLRSRRRRAGAAGDAARRGLQALPALRPPVRVRRDLPRPPRPLRLPQLRPAAAGAGRARDRASSCTASASAAFTLETPEGSTRGPSCRCPVSTTSTTRSRPRRCAARSASRWSRSRPGWRPWRPPSGAPRRSPCAAAPTSLLLVKNPAGANEVLRTLTLEGARARRARRPQRQHRRRPRRLLGLGRRLGAARAASGADGLRRHARGRAGGEDASTRGSTRPG